MQQAGTIAQCWRRPLNHPQEMAPNAAQHFLEGERESERLRGLRLVSLEMASKTQIRKSRGSTRCGRVMGPGLGKVYMQQVDGGEKLQEPS